MVADARPRSNAHQTACAAALRLAEDRICGLTPLGTAASAEADHQPGIHSSVGDDGGDDIDITRL